MKSSISVIVDLLNDHSIYHQILQTYAKQVTLNSDEEYLNSTEPKYQVLRFLNRDDKKNTDYSH